MTSVLTQGLSKSFVEKSGKRVVALDDVDLEIHDGELLVLLGPSGCGKTTMLRSIAGFERPESGRISFGDRAVFDAARSISLPPEKRSIGMIFQSYALWPHKTVRANIAYPLRAQKKAEGLKNGWVEQAAELVDCRHLLDRYPGQLSGGQQQRVALARGLVARPGVVLFDEPLSNLDAGLRDFVRGEIHQLHESLRFTGVYVTHDQAEALALGDRLAIMRDGRIEQLDTPTVAFDRPASDYVAGFLGYKNRIVLSRTDDGWQSAFGRIRGLRSASSRDVDEIILRIRPEDLGVTRRDAQRADVFVVGAATIVDRTFAGRQIELQLRRESCSLRAIVDRSEDDPAAMPIGAEVSVTVRSQRAVFFAGHGARLDVDWIPAFDHAVDGVVLR